MYHHRAAVREALFAEHLEPIISAAHEASVDIPALERIDVNEEIVRGARLVTAARRILRAVTPFQGALIRMGLPLDFIRQFHEAIDDVELSMMTTDDQRAARATAKIAIRLHERTARRLLRRIDLVVQSELGTAHPAFADWAAVARRLPQTQTR